MKTKEEPTNKTKKKSHPQAEPRRLYRSRKDVIIAGVAAGIGEYLAIDASIIRLLFIITTFVSGFGFLVYIILWAILPVEKNDTIATEATVKHNIAEMREKANSFAQEFKRNHKGSGRKIFAIILIIIGAILILESLNLFNKDFFLPMVLIVVGLLILFSRK